MLFLIFADGHMCSPVDKYVGGLQHWIGKQADAHAFAVLTSLILKLRHPVEPADARGAKQHPREFSMAGHTRLVEQDRTVGINAARDQCRGHFAGVCRQRGGIIIHCNCVQIGKEIQAVALHFILHLHPVFNRTQIIAKMQIPRGLNAGNDAHQLAFLRLKY